MFLYAYLDYQTSERAGAGGMFQVISITDEDDNEFTDFVNVGKHYHELSELKEDLEIALNTEIQLEQTTYFVPLHETCKYVCVSM